MITAPWYLGLQNLWYRGRDPTRGWVGSGGRVAVDVGRCMLAGTVLGGDVSGISVLGPSENARGGSRGFPVWYSLGVSCSVEEGRLADFAISFLTGKRERAFDGDVLFNGERSSLNGGSKMAAVVSLMDEPFWRSRNEWDTATVLFYESALGEVQFAFDKETGLLESIECWYEPELGQEGACATYGIEKDFPGEFRRVLGGG